MMTVQYEPKPFRSATRQVQPEWIDYNGHMNVGYYALAIDQCIDDIFDELGVGVALVSKYRMGPMAMAGLTHYLDELLEGQHFYIDLQILDSDHKRMHYFVNMHHVEKGTIAATFEALSMNVDLEARKSAPYPEEALVRIRAMTEAHAGLPRPPQAGATIGIRRKG